MSKQTERVNDLTGNAIKIIFQSMASMEMVAEPPAPPLPNPARQIVASVGFIGKTSGVIYLYFDIEFAAIITSRMLGIPAAEFSGDEMVNDAMGELTNMVVGYVKSNLQDDGLALSLTIPTIVRGQQLSVEGSSDVAKTMLGFRSGDHRMIAEVFLKDS